MSRDGQGEGRAYLWSTPMAVHDSGRVLGNCVYIGGTCAHASFHMQCRAHVGDPTWHYGTGAYVRM